MRRLAAVQGSTHVPLASVVDIDITAAPQGRRNHNHRDHGGRWRTQTKHWRARARKSGGPRTFFTAARVVCNHHVGRARSSSGALPAVSPQCGFSRCREMIARAKRITFLGFDVGDWLILIIGIALVGLLLVLA